MAADLGAPTDLRTKERLGPGYLRGAQFAIVSFPQHLQEGLTPSLGREIQEEWDSAIGGPTRE